MSVEFSRKEIIEILSTNSRDREIFSLADSVRKQYVGDDIYVRGLIEFSNICKRNCLYCGLQCDNKAIERYRLDPNDIVKCAQNAVNNLGYKTLVLQSGEDAYFSTDVICNIIKEIKKLDTALTLSIGERSYEDYLAFKQSGADRYLIRIETTDKELYAKMHPNSDYNNRVKCLYNLKELGYEVGTGCLVGLPGQTIDSLADDILFFKEIEADMIGIGPFIPHPQTPLVNSKSGDLTTALKVMALTRILLKDINIPATTAMETLSSDGRILALKCGANVVMPNVTDEISRQKYEIYPNKSGILETPQSHRVQIENKILSIGRQISDDYGFRKRKNT